MAEFVDIDIDWGEVEKKLNKFLKVPDKMSKALNMALNETIKGAKTEAGKKIKENYTVKRKGDITGNLKAVLSTKRTLMASVETRGRPLALTKSKFRKNTKRLTAFANPKALSPGGRTGGFAAVMDSGHMGIFVRTGRFEHTTSSNKEESKKRAKTKKGIEPLRQLFGPGTSQMLANDDITKEIAEKVKERFEKSLDRAIEQVLRQEMGN